MTSCTILRWYIGARPELAITDIEMLKVILVKEFESFVDREVSLHTVVALDQLMKNLPSNKDNPVTLFGQFGLPQGLLFAQGETWRNARHHITPTFSSNKIKLVQYSCVLIETIRTA